MVAPINDDIKNLKSAGESLASSLNIFMQGVGQSTKPLIADVYRMANTVKELNKKQQKEYAEGKITVLKTIKELEAEATKIEAKRQEEYYRRATILEKEAFLKRQKNDIERDRNRLEQLYAERMAQAETDEERKKVDEEYWTKRHGYEQASIENEEKLAKVTEKTYKIRESVANKEEKARLLRAKYDEDHKKLQEKELAIVTKKEKLAELQEKASKGEDVQDEITATRSELERQENELIKERIQLAKESVEASRAETESKREQLRIQQQLAETDERVESILAPSTGKKVKTELEKESEEKHRQLEEAKEYEKSLKRQRAAAEADAKEKGTELSDEEKAYYDNAIRDAQSQTDALATGVAELDILIAVTEKAAEETKKQLQKAFDTVVKALEGITTKVDKNIEAIKGYQSAFMARLQGSDKNYYTIMDIMKRNLTGSPFVSQAKVLDNLSRLVDAGIAYNVEERAFLATMSDKIATTFDGFNSNLMRLIRVQQADTTAARLGMEAYLTKFLNNMFSDTSYLSDMAKTISAAIIDAESHMSYQGASEFEYILQKWLGSLYALGMSEKAVSDIASGINMLATGDVQGLASNMPMQTLIAMGASRIGMDIGKDITDGLNASQLNDLMQSMVLYLKEIATNSDNNAVKAAFGDIFDMSFSDFASIQNLTQKDIENIYQSTLTYEQASKELTNQFMQLPLRLSIGELVTNAFENVMFSASESIASDPIGYSTWLLISAIEGITGGTTLPSVFGMGTGIDISSLKLETAVKSGIAGFSMFMQLGNLISSALSGFGLGGIYGDMFNAWNATQTTSRGSGILAPYTGVSTGVSQSEYIGSGSAGDVKRASVQAAADEAKEVQQITNPNADKEKSLTDFWEAFYDDKSPIPIYAPEPIAIMSKDTLSVYDSKAFGNTSSIFTALNDYVESVLDKNSGAVKITVSSAQGTSSSSITSNISSLMTDIMFGNATTVVVANDINAKLVDTDKTFEDKIKVVMQQARASLHQGSSVMTPEEEDALIKEVLEKIANGELSVQVKNTYFDEYLQKAIMYS